MLEKLNCYVARVSILLITLAFLITVALIVGMVGCAPHSQNLEIRTWYDLDAVRNNLAGNHILMNDLDSTTAGYTQLASPSAKEGKGWQPIPSFTGSFDGQGYKIRDLFINRPGENYTGLFAYVGEGGRIEDIGELNTTVTGNEFVGSLVASNDGTVSNSYSTGGVTGEKFVGGLIGCNDGTVSNSYSTSSVTGGGVLPSHVGGLVGWNGGTVSNSYSTGSVTAGRQSFSYAVYVGGLVGYNFGNVSNSYSTGSVSGDTAVGGLVGSAWQGTVSDSHSSGSVAGDDQVGGLLGSNAFTSNVSNSYSTGSVAGNENVGGLVGANSGTVDNSYSTGSVSGNSSGGGLVGYNNNDWGTVSNSFWDTETSGQATSDGGTGKTTTQMKDIATFSGVDWDIIAVALNQTNLAYTWNIVDGVTYPFLSWQSVS